MPLTLSTDPPDAARGRLAALYLNPRNVDALRMRAKIETASHRYDDAITDLNAALVIEPRNGETYVARSVAYYRRRDCVAAIRDFEAAIQQDGGLARLGRSACLLEAGDTKEAPRAADTAIARDGTDAGAFSLRGLARERDGDLKGGLAYLTEVVRLGPAFPAAYLN